MAAWIATDQRVKTPTIRALFGAATDWPQALIGVQLLGPALPPFRDRYPKLAVDLRLSDRRFDMVDEGIDVAIRVGELEDSP